MPNRSTFATTRISIRSMHLTRINVEKIGRNHAVTSAWGVTSGERNYGTQWGRVQSAWSIGLMYGRYQLYYKCTVLIFFSVPCYLHCDNSNSIIRICAAQTIKHRRINHHSRRKLIITRNFKYIVFFERFFFNSIFVKKEKKSLILNTGRSALKGGVNAV